MLARSQALAVGEELVAERPPGRLLEASPRPALIWRAWSMIRPARQAARTVRLYLVAAAPADDDQEVLVNPGDLGAGQAGQERRDGRAQLIRRVEGERRVVAPLSLGPEPLERA